MSSAPLDLAASGEPLSARAVVEALGLRGRGGTAGRPRVAATMIASVDGRSAVQGRSVALGHPADRALLRELRTGVDAILVGAGTLEAERYANLLDPDQRAQRLAVGLPEHPLVATISRRLDLAPEVPVLADPTTPVLVYTESDGTLADGHPAVDVHRFAPGTLTVPAVLAHLWQECGAQAVLCEGGPGLLARLVAAECLDDLLFTLSPLLVAGTAPTVLTGPVLDPPVALHLRAVRRGGDHLLLHYEAVR
jgi:riboflavin biosynthesis pyrimidine reductase